MLARRLRPVLERALAATTSADVFCVPALGEVRVGRDRLARVVAEDPSEPYILWNSRPAPKYDICQADVLEEWLDLARIDEPQWG